MKNIVCLNCNEAVERNYCSNCGQKTDTHPITFRHFIFHDLLHGVWHLEKGIIFTIREAFKRPGQTALDYINGKRVRYYNVFYLCLIITAITILLNHLCDLVHTPEPVSKDIEKVTAFMATYLKLLLFGIIPILAINALLIYKKLKLNITQHFIISGMSLLGVLLLNIVYLIIYFINCYQLFPFFNYLEALSIIVIILFPGYVLFDATKKVYPLKSFLWRIVLFYMMVLIQMLFIVRFIAFLITGKMTIFGLS